MEVGSLFIIGLEEDEWPFGVGKRMQGGTEDEMTFQWISNRSGNIRGRHQAGWLNKNGEVYWNNKRRHRGDTPYLGSDSGTKIGAT